MVKRRNVRRAGIPATGQPVTFRTTSPQAGGRQSSSLQFFNQIRNRLNRHPMQLRFCRTVISQRRVRSLPDNPASNLTWSLRKIPVRNSNAHRMKNSVAFPFAVCSAYHSRAIAWV
jgi:hypothetical protein